MNTKKESPEEFKIEIAGKDKGRFNRVDDSTIKEYQPSTNTLKIKRKNLKDLQIKNNLGEGGSQLFNCFDINYVNRYGMCNLLNLQYILNKIQSGGKYYEKSFNRPIGKIKNKDNTDKKRYLGKKIREHKENTDKILNKGYLYCGIIDYIVHKQTNRKVLKQTNKFHLFLEITAKGKNASDYEIGNLKLVEDGDFKEQFNQLILIFKKSENISNLKNSQNIYNLDTKLNNYVKILTRYTIILYITNYFKNVWNDKDIVYNITDIIKKNQILNTSELKSLIRMYEVTIEKEKMYKIAYDLIYFSKKTTKLQLNLQSLEEIVNEVYKMVPKNKDPVEHFEKMVPSLKEVIETRNNWTNVSDIMHQYNDAKISIS